MKTIDVDKVTQLLYKFYGTDSGVLFGLSSDKRGLVHTIVQAASNIIEDMYEVLEGEDAEGDEEPF